MAHWLIWSNEHQAWWRPDHCGYTPFIEEAGRYTLAVASKIVDEANAGGPLPATAARTGAKDIAYEALVLAPEAVSAVAPFITAGRLGVEVYAAVEVAALRVKGLSPLSCPQVPAGVHAAESQISFTNWRDIAALGE